MSNKLALFDLDHTLINGDSDHAWGEFMAAHGLVDPAVYKAANDQFYADYQAGKLDMQAYLEFALAPLAKHPLEKLLELRKRFMNEVIEPMVLKLGLERLDFHRQQGHTLVIITSTNRFVTEPIALRLEVQYLIATEPEQVAGKYTGKVSGIPSFKEGKIQRLREWLVGRNESLENSCFYSDSVNDLPLLEMVTHPVAVDPDSKLREHALKRGWEIMSLR